MFTEQRKERTVADTLSGDRFLNATKKRRLGLEFIGLEQVSGINLFDNEILMISSDSKWYKVCFRWSNQPFDYISWTALWWLSKPSFFKILLLTGCIIPERVAISTTTPNVSHGILHSKPAFFSIKHDLSDYHVITDLFQDPFYPNFQTSNIFTPLLFPQKNSTWLTCNVVFVCKSQGLNIHIICNFTSPTQIPIQSNRIELKNSLGLVGLFWDARSTQILWKGKKYEKGAKTWHFLFIQSCSA